MILTLVSLLLLSRFSKYSFNIDDRKRCQETYYGLIDALYHPAKWLILKLINHPIGRSYLRWHRLLYSNRSVDDQIVSTASKSLVLMLMSIGLIVDGVILNIEMSLWAILVPIALLLPTIPIFKIKREYIESCQKIMRELPGFIQQMALLIKSGTTARQSVDVIFKHTTEEQGIRILLKHIYFENEMGNDFFQSFSVLSEFIHHKSIHHLGLLMGQVKRSGVHQFSVQLVELADMMMVERQTYIRVISEQLSTKLLLPMMISMVTILSLLIYPIITQLK